LAAGSDAQLPATLTLANNHLAKSILVFRRGPPDDEFVGLQNSAG
jgi:hypothetical protein